MTEKFPIEIELILEKTISVALCENMVEVPEYETVTLLGKLTFTLLSGLGKGLVVMKIILMFEFSVDICKLEIENTIVFKIFVSVTDE